MRSRRVLRRSSAEGELMSGSRIHFHGRTGLVSNALALILIPMSLGAAEIAVDHVTAAGKDLKAMRASLEAIGLTSEYGGPHSNRATEMALVSFLDGSYLELIAIQPNADPKA